MATQPNGNSEGIKKASNSFSQTTVLTVGYVAGSVVSAVMVARIILGFLRPKKLVSEDYCVFVAYAFFVSQCALYITIAPVSDRVMAVQEGRAPYYPELIAEGFLLGRLYFAALIIFWIILWLVKFGLLFLYRKLMVGLPGYYNKIWWFIVVFCALTEVGNFVCYIESCEQLKGFFNGGCHDRTRQFMSVWYSYSADTLTNIMIIALPMHLTWDLHLPRGQKIGKSLSLPASLNAAMRDTRNQGLFALFVSAILCILIATLRAAQITSNTIRTDADTDGTWLAVWGMAECAVAVVIGLTPSFAVLIRASRKAGKKTPHGYGNKDEQEFQVTTIGGSGGSGNRRKQKSAENCIEMNDSQEALAGRHDAVSVTTSAHQDEESMEIAK